MTPPQLEARWASLVPYAVATGLLADILPIGSSANATTLREHVLHVAERAETELAEERPRFIDGAHLQASISSAHASSCLRNSDRSPALGVSQSPFPTLICSLRQKCSGAFADTD